MGDARIDRKPVPLDAAIAQAARMLDASRLPVIGGLGADIAGTRAAVALAERIGGVIDHMHSDAVLRDLAVMREAGSYVTTPNEARLRADTLLLVGPGLLEAWPELVARLTAAPNAREVDNDKRRITWLGTGKGAALPGASMIGRDPRDLPILLAQLRACIGGRPAGKVPRPIATLADSLKTARFGVAVWSAAALDELVIAMLAGLIDDLNATTRFTALPLAPADNAIGALQACGWMTGFPMRTGFGRGYPEHDPWRCDARRLIESGEADCAVWIASYRPTTPPWTRRVPMITLANAPPRDTDGVVIQVGQPGLDHDAVEHSAMTGTLTARAAEQKSALPSVADVIARIATALPDGAWPC